MYIRPSVGIWDHATSKWYTTDMHDRVTVSDTPEQADTLALCNMLAYADALEAALAASEQLEEALRAENRLCDRTLRCINSLMWDSHMVRNGPPIPADRIMALLEEWAAGTQAAACGDSQDRLRLDAVRSVARAANDSLARVANGIEAEEIARLKAEVERLSAENKRLSATTAFTPAPRLGDKAEIFGVGKCVLIESESGVDINTMTETRRFVFVQKRVVKA